MLQLIGSTNHSNQMKEKATQIKSSKYNAIDLVFVHYVNVEIQYLFTGRLSTHTHIMKFDRDA